VTQEEVDPEVAPPAEEVRHAAMMMMIMIRVVIMT
jgi:hypothetical protein